jgi:hypothetical protein
MLEQSLVEGILCFKLNLRRDLFFILNLRLFELQDLAL